MTRLVGLALALHVLAPAGALAGPSGLRQFNDWMVGCDNTLSCRAIGVQEDGPDEEAYLVIDRAGGPDAPPRLHVGGGDLSLGDGFAWSVDGKAPTSVPGSAVSAPAASDEGDTPPPEVGGPAAAAILAAMRDGKELRLAADTDGLAQASPLPLKGLAAALLFMDDVQGRVGTATALARPGKKQAAAVPPAPGAPLIVPDALPDQSKLPSDVPEGIVAKHAKTLGKNSDCEDYGGVAKIPARQFRLAGEKILYLIGCWRAAYQAGEVAYLAHAATPTSTTPLPFETIDEKTGKLEINMTSITDADGLEGETTSLSSFHKGRGAGDCGTQWRWAWSGGKMRLTAYVTMPSCHSIEDGDWITLWRSREK